MDSSYPGLLVVFEGPDGTGKTTRAISLKRDLEASRRRVLLLKELHTTFLGKRLRELINDPSVPLSETTLAFLFHAVREHLNTSVIIPALKEGKVVIMDRYYHSTLAYQLKEESCIKDHLKMIRNSTSITKPDVTFVLTKVFKRNIDNDRFELLPDKVKDQVRSIYLKDCFINDENIIHIKEHKTTRTVEEEIYKVVCTLLKEKERYYS